LLILYWVLPPVVVSEKGAMLVCLLWNRNAESKKKVRHVTETDVTCLTEYFPGQLDSQMLDFNFLGEALE